MREAPGGVAGREDSIAAFLSRDIIDQELRQICDRRPEILEDNTIVRKSQGRYRINGREVSISLVTRETKEEENGPGDSVLPSKCPSSNMAEVIEEVNQLASTPFEANPDDLIVRDGPLTQPFLDYVFDTGARRLSVLSWWVLRWVGRLIALVVRYSQQR
eukprot:Skav228429  [mRNA]  locus=scaffold1325:378296:379341:- [translate_table: standard]